MDMHILEHAEFHLLCMSCSSRPGKFNVIKQVTCSEYNSNELALFAAQGTGLTPHNVEAIRRSGFNGQMMLSQLQFVHQFNNSSIIEGFFENLGLGEASASALVRCLFHLYQIAPRMFNSM